MKKLTLLLTIFVSIVTLSVTVHAEVLYSTFGPGQSFDSESIGWLVGLSYKQQIAAPFFLSFDAILDSINFAADNDNGPTQLTVNLVYDDSGLPSTEVIESFSFTNLSSLPTIYTANSSRKPLLKGSASNPIGYWVILIPQNSMTLVRWNWNNIGKGGFAYWNTATRWTYNNDKTPAFDIKGNRADLLEVDILIKPGSNPDSIISYNPTSRGVIPVAILTTKDFDATTVNPRKVLFGKAPAFQYKFEDVDGDGDIDMILHFINQETGILCGDTEAILTGKTLNGQAIKGSQSIKTVGCEKRRP